MSGSGEVNFDGVLDVINTVKGDSPDFLQRNGTWLLTLAGLIIGCVGAVLTYFLKSRCTEISFGCVSCKRQPLELQASDINITAESV